MGEVAGGTVGSGMRGKGGRTISRGIGAGVLVPVLVLGL